MITIKEHLLRTVDFNSYYLSQLNEIQIENLVIGFNDSDYKAFFSPFSDLENFLESKAISHITISGNHYFIFDKDMTKLRDKAKFFIPEFSVEDGQSHDDLDHHFPCVPCP